MKKLLILTAMILPLGGCITVARTPNGEWIAAVPLSGEVAESGWARVGNAAATAAPYADLLVPGLGAALVSALSAGGWGAYRDFKGEKKARERELALQEEMRRRENAAWDEAKREEMLLRTTPATGA